MLSLLTRIRRVTTDRAQSRGRRSREAAPGPRLRTAALFGALIGALVMLLHHTSPTGVNLLWRLELLSYDWRISLRDPVTPDDIVIVAIDHESISNYGAWPWPRALHAELLNRLADAGARVVGVDIVFSDVSSGIDLNSDDWLSEKPLSGDDEALRAAIAGAGWWLAARSMRANRLAATWRHRHLGELPARGFKDAGAPSASSTSTRTSIVPFAAWL